MLPAYEERSIATEEAETKILNTSGILYKGLLKFKAPKHNFEFFCRANKDDFKLMTVHEDEIINKFIPEPGDIVIDVGAHIGLYAIIGSRRVGPWGKIISLEPHPDNYKILKRN